MYVGYGQGGVRVLGFGGVGGNGQRRIRELGGREIKGIGGEQGSGDLSLGRTNLHRS